MKQLLAAFGFLTIAAAAQSLPAGSATVVEISQRNPSVPCTILQLAIIPQACQAFVAVRAAASGDHVVGFMIMLLYKDAEGKMQIRTELTKNREGETPWFNYVFLGMDGSTVVSAIAVPLDVDPTRVGQSSAMQNIP